MLHILKYVLCLGEFAIESLEACFKGRIIYYHDLPGGGKIAAYVMKSIYLSIQYNLQQ